jgi:hypothetical protein
MRPRSTACPAHKALTRVNPKAFFLTRRAGFREPQAILLSGKRGIFATFSPLPRELKLRRAGARSLQQLARDGAPTGPIDSAKGRGYRRGVMATRRAPSTTAWRRHAIRRMLAVRRATLALVTRLPEPEILRPRTQDQWSVKDVLGHLLSCDEETLRRFRLIARGRGDRIVWFESMAHADRFNARTVARTRRYGLAALLRRMARAHADLVERLRRLPAPTLRDPSHKYTVVDWLPVPGWTHERDHRGEGWRWWRTRRAELRGR